MTWVKWNILTATTDAALNPVSASFDISELTLVCLCVRALVLWIPTALSARAASPIVAGRKSRAGGDEIWLIKSSSADPHPPTPDGRAHRYPSPPSPICRTPKRTGVKVEGKGYPFRRTEQWNRTHAVKGSCTYTERVSGTRRHGEEGQRLNFGGNAVYSTSRIWSITGTGTQLEAVSARRSKSWHRVTVVYWPGRCSWPSQWSSCPCLLTVSAPVPPCICAWSWYVHESVHVHEINVSCIELKGGMAGACYFFAGRGGDWRWFFFPSSVAVLKPTLTTLNKLVPLNRQLNGVIPWCYLSWWDLLLLHTIC